jgi:hypothetical protein
MLIAVRIRAVSPGNGQSDIIDSTIRKLLEHTGKDTQGGPS